MESNRSRLHQQGLMEGRDPVSGFAHWVPDQPTRERRLRDLGIRWSLEIGGNSNSADEDFTEYFVSPRQPIRRYAAITTAGDFVYIKADYPNLNEAKEAALANVNDNIYAETPLAVVDLDTGRTYQPDFSTIVWRQS